MGSYRFWERHRNLHRMRSEKEGVMKYKVNVGMNYPVKGVLKRAEAGQMVSDLPLESIDWLIAQGAITLVASAPAKAEKE